jgi:hypothetical protein
MIRICFGTVYSIATAANVPFAALNARVAAWKGVGGLLSLYASGCNLSCVPLNSGATAALEDPQPMTQCLA